MIQSLTADGMEITYVAIPVKDDSQTTIVLLHGFTSQKLGWIPL